MLAYAFLPRPSRGLILSILSDSLIIPLDALPSVIDVCPIPISDDPDEISEAGLREGLANIMTLGGSDWPPDVIPVLVRSLKLDLDTSNCHIRAVRQVLERASDPTLAQFTECGGFDELKDIMDSARFQNGTEYLQTIPQRSVDTEICECIHALACVAARGNRWRDTVMMSVDRILEILVMQLSPSQTTQRVRAALAALEAFAGGVGSPPFPADIISPIVKCLESKEKDVVAGAARVLTGLIVHDMGCSGIVRSLIPVKFLLKNSLQWGMDVLRLIELTG